MMEHLIKLKSTVLFCNAFLLVIMNARAQDLNIGSRIQPIPPTAKFMSDLAYMGVATPVKSKSDHTYHPFHPGWPMKYGMDPRVGISELAPVVSKVPSGISEKRNSTLPGGDDQWKLDWSDEFEYPDANLDQKWESQNGPSGHILCSRWRENAVVSNGTLKLVNRKENRGGQEWTSGNIWTKQQFQYGYFECRYRYAAAEGTNNSFWLMMKGIQPLKGKFFELDINEGHYPNSVNTNIHNHTDVTEVNGKKTHPSASKGFKFEKVDLAKDFHIYGLDWSKEELVFYFDGKEIRREKNQFCHSPAPVWLSLAIIPWAGKITDAINGTQMEIDYVRIYTTRNSTTTSPR